MAARLYALAWRVLPFMYCAPLGAMLGFVLMQLWRAAK